MHGQRKVGESKRERGKKRMRGREGREGEKVTGKEGGREGGIEGGRVRGRC